MAPVIGDFLAKCATRVAYTGISSAALSINHFVLRIKVGLSVGRKRLVYMAYGIVDFLAKYATRAAYTGKYFV